MIKNGLARAGWIVVGGRRRTAAAAPGRRVTTWGGEAQVCAQSQHHTHSTILVLGGKRVQRISAPRDNMGFDTCRRWGWVFECRGRAARPGATTVSRLLCWRGRRGCRHLGAARTEVAPGSETRTVDRHRWPHSAEGATSATTTAVVCLAGCAPASLRVNSAYQTLTNSALHGTRCRCHMLCEDDLQE
jgi:hypothetical protein